MLTNNDIDLFLKVRKELDKLCETYANKHLACWQHYTGWNCYSNYIVINYIYNNFDDFNDSDKLVIPLSDFLEEASKNTTNI